MLAKCVLSFLELNWYQRFRDQEKKLKKKKIQSGPRKRKRKKCCVLFRSLRKQLEKCQPSFFISDVTWSSQVHLQLDGLTYLDGVINKKSKILRDLYPFQHAV